MSFEDDWRALGQAWRERCDVDADAALRKLRRLRHRSMLMIGLELAALAACTVQLVEVARSPAAGSWSGWAWITLVGAWGLQGLLIYLRRGLHRGHGRMVVLTPAALAQHTVARARTAIRLAWLNVIGMVALALIAVPFAWTYADTHADRRRLIAPAIVAGVYGVVFAIAVRWYIRRQRRTIAAARPIATDLAERTEDGPESESTPGGG